MARPATPSAPSTSTSETLSGYLSTLPAYKSTDSLFSYYSDLASKRVNDPSAYNRIVSWWNDRFEHILSHGLQTGDAALNPPADRLILRVNDELLGRLRWDRTSPLALGTATEELVRQSHLIPLSLFLSSPKSIYSSAWPSWVFANLVQAPLTWALGKLNIIDAERGVSHEENWRRAKGSYVHVYLVERAAENIMEHYKEMSTLSLPSRLYTSELFRTEFASHAFPDTANRRLSADDIQVLLRYLARDKRVLVYEKEKDVVRWLKEGELVAEARINETDRGVLGVKEAHTKVRKQTEELEERIAERQTKIRHYASTSQKDLALTHIRSRKALESLLLKRLGALENLTSVLLSIEQASSDAEILSAYKSSTATLRSILKDPRLDRDNVDKTMEEMADAVADQREIDEAMRMGGESVADLGEGALVDEEELERELAELVKEDEKKKEKAKVSGKAGEEVAGGKKDEAEPEKAATADAGKVVASEEKEQAEPTAA